MQNMNSIDSVSTLKFRTFLCPAPRYVLSDVSVDLVRAIGRNQ